LYFYGTIIYQHSFPTRRSSDLYLRLLERVAWDHSWALGVDWQLFERLNRGMVVRYTELDYLAPARPGDHLELATWIVENDNRIRDRKSTRLNSSHVKISYAVFC